MIKSVFGGLNTAVRALQNAQAGIQTASRNIAGANDPAYTRQMLRAGTEGEITGRGVLRSRIGFIDNQFRSAASTLGFSEGRRDMLRRVEDIFADPINGGIRQGIDNFFQAWHALAENPTDPVHRIQVLTAGQQFVGEIKSAYERVTQAMNSVGESLVTKVSEVNHLLGSVFEMNKRIATMERNSLPSAELRDQRDLVADKLAKLTGALVHEQADGTYRITVGPNVILDGPTMLKLELGPGSGSGPVPSWSGALPALFQGGGEIGGMLSVRETEMQRIRQDLDTLGRTVASHVNAIHVDGFGLLDQVQRPFFLIGNNPAELMVNPDLTPERVAVASMPGRPGDGTIARRLAALEDQPQVASAMLPGQPVSARGFYRSLVGALGTETRAAIDSANLASAHQMVAEQQRQSNWGVALDEEMADLTMQQKAFAAASRAMTAMDEMLDALINRTGVVGR